MRNKKIIILLFSLFCLSLFLFPYKGWNQYYKKKLYQPAASLTIQSSELFSNSGLAIDFGCGCGNDTAYLLSKGWTVWATDGELAAIECLAKRKDIQKTSPLFTATEKFEEINWSKLPTSDLFIAIYALPFCKKEEFNKLWKQITNKIKLQGVFAGHFFGPSYQGFTDKEKREMTFLTKEEVLSLFKGFEVKFFLEKEEDSISGTGRKIHSHIFEVIAVKVQVNNSK